MKSYQTLLITLFLMVQQPLKSQHMTATVNSGILKNEATTIHYQESGYGEQTILFVHGWCINSSYWSHQMTFFEDKYRVVAIDLPGFGQSTAQRNEWTIENYAADVLFVIEELKLKNVVLVGHSMAGEIVLEATLQKQPDIAGIIGVDNFKIIDFPFSKEQMDQMDVTFGQMKSDFIHAAPAYADYMLFHPSTSREVKEKVKHNISNTDPSIGISTLENLWNYSYKEGRKLEELDFKLYLINSDAVPTYTPGLENHCKKSFEILEIPATGHYPMVEKPEQFNQLMQEALDKIFNKV